MPMKILLATPTFPPFKDGVSEAAAAQAQAFAREGFDVHVATQPHPNRLADPWKGKIIIHEFAVSGSPHFRSPYHGDTNEYRRLLISEPWDTIVFHSYSWPLYLAADLFLQIRAKKILTSHGYGALVWTPVRQFPFGLGSLAWSFAKSMAMLRWYKYLDRVVFLDSKIDTNTFYDHFLARISRHKGIRIIPNGVGFPIADSDRLSQGFLVHYRIPHTSCLFLCVANYSWRKDQEFAVKAFRQAAIPESALVFIGSEFNECSEAFQRADAARSSEPLPGNVIWLEKVNRADTLGALQACDAFVLSAKQEAQPIALLEAMSYGKPWIAREAGCIDRMEGGLCVGSTCDMAKAMRRIARDTALRSRLGAEGRRAVEVRYSVSQYGTSYVDLLKEEQKK
jgi:glycosyltransferase involved in cell wall biosynthesis